jgi:hypothetical protein
MTLNDTANQAAETSGHSTELLRHALLYASLGFPVFPLHSIRNGLCTCGKADCAAPGKHPRFDAAQLPNGVQDATTNQDEIGMWWMYLWPDANIGIATGHGMFALDIDPKHGGSESLAALLHEYGQLPDTASVITGGGGEHHYFPCGETAPCPKNSAGKLGPGLDIRGSGGYVVAPPSLHHSGGSYTWELSSHIAEVEMAPAPEWLLKLASSAAPEAPALDGSSPIPEGQRNNTLASIAGSMRQRGLSPEEIVPSLLAVNASRSKPPLPEPDVRRIAQSVGRYPAPALVAPRIPSAGQEILSSFVRTSDGRDSPERPPFPTDVLPEPVRSYVTEGAATFGVPEDYIAVPLMPILGGIMGRNVRIKMKEGYEQYAALFAGIVAPSGHTKTPALRYARHPLQVLQKEAYTRSDGTAPDDFYTTDVTIEALAPMLQTSPGLTVVADELIGWMYAQNEFKNGKGADRQRWLSLWAQEEIKIDRKGSPTIYIPDPVVSVTGGIQPGILSKIIPNDGDGDGYFERLLLSYPEGRAPAWTEDTVSQATIDALVDLARALRKRTASTPIRLSAAAQQKWAQWYNQNGASLGNEQGVLRNIRAKMPNHAARFALILHVLQYPGAPEETAVGQETLQGAIKIADYFLAHARYILDLAVRTRQTREAPKSLYDRVNEIILAAPEGISRSDIHKKLGNNVKREELDSVLQALSNDGVACQREEASGGRPRQLWFPC